MTSDTKTTPKLMLDLSRRIETFPHGDITAILTWTLHNARPALVLIPALAILHFDRVTPCIVPLESAWAWDEATGDGAHCAEVSFSFACALGFEPSPGMLLRITGIIRDHLGDLILAPSMPRLYDDRIVADVVMLNTETGKITEAEVIENV